MKLQRTQKILRPLAALIIGAQVYNAAVIIKTNPPNPTSSNGSDFNINVCLYSYLETLGTIWLF